MSLPCLSVDGSDVLIRLKVKPRGSRTALGAFDGDQLEVKVSAPPADGKANDAVEKLLAKTLRTGTRNVRVVKGQKSRLKTVAISNLDIRAVEQRLRAVVD